MVGLFEPEAASWMVDKVPPDFSFGEIPPGAPNSNPNEIPPDAQLSPTVCMSSSHTHQASLCRSVSFGRMWLDWDRMAPFLEKAMSRVPRTLEVAAAFKG